MVLRQVAQAVAERWRVEWKIGPYRPEGVVVGASPSHAQVHVSFPSGEVKSLPPSALRPLDHPDIDASWQWRKRRVEGE